VPPTAELVDPERARRKLDETRELIKQTETPTCCTSPTGRTGTRRTTSASSKRATSSATPLGGLGRTLPPDGQARMPAVRAVASMSWRRDAPYVRPVRRKRLYASEPHASACAVLRTLDRSSSPVAPRGLKPCGSGSETARACRI